MWSILLTAVTGLAYVAETGRGGPQGALFVRAKRRGDLAEFDFTIRISLVDRQ